MLRRTTLTLLMLVSIGVMLPIARSTAHGIRQSVEASSSRRHYRRHSRAWWRRYRARLRRRRAAALAALAAHRNAPLSQFTTVVSTAPIPGSTTLPTSDLPQPANAAEMRYRSDSAAPTLPGQSTLAVVALSRPEPAYLTAREQKRYFSGIPTADLRRIVIDKMLAVGGWVVNDYERDLAGHRVFVVTAQTPSNGRSPEKSWNFYFAEVNGRIYNLTTNTPPQFGDRMEIEAERFLASLYAKQSTQASTR